MKIVVDIMGGDNAPQSILEGAEQALLKSEDLRLVLVGKKDIIDEYFAAHSENIDRIEVVDAQDIIDNNDVPTEAIRKKRESSLVKSFDYLNEHVDAVGFVSAGSTGAVLTGAVLHLKRIRGINRPALCPVLPTVTDKEVILIDCGANSEVKALNLVQFALMGSAYVKALYNLEKPVVGLLSNGAEEHKGNAVNREAYPMLQADERINFYGNIEARDILSGDVDVVICDGYSGNIALKACEGTALSMFKIIKKNIMEGGFRAKLGYLLLKPAFKKVKKTMDYNDNGGAIMLGLEKVVVKSHGSSKALAICNSILQVEHLYKSKVVENIKATL